MKTTKLMACIALMFTAGIQVKAQSLRIVYDFIKDEISYYKTKPGDPIGKPVASPVVGRNKVVTVEVVNFNKFVYAANATYTSKVVETQSDMGFMDIITPLVNPLGSSSFFTALGGTLPEEIGRGGVLSTRGASSAYDDILNAYQNLTSLEASLKSIEYAGKKLNKLKYNPYLPTDTIVSMSSHIVSQIFNKPTVNPSDFSSVIVQLTKDYTSSVSNLKMATKDFISQYDDYAKSRGDQQFEGRGLDQTVRNFNQQVNQVTEVINPDYITQQVDHLETVYTSIIATQFKFNSSHAAKDDEIDLLLSFFKIPIPEDGAEPETANMNNLETLPKVKEKRVNITVKGDIKVTTGVGLAFPNFKNTNDYLNRDSFIISQPGSNSSPNLAAYVNFYPYTGRSFHLGGTFGVGVPLQSDGQNRSVNMLMGLTTLFGSDGRVGLHGGFSLGQVQHLGEGYEVGDQLLTPTQEVPVRNVWEWGTFIGVSFNIGKAGG